MVTVKPKMPVSPAEPETPKKPDPKAPTVRPKIEPVKKPKLPEVKPDIPDIEYTGSGIELPLMPAVAFHEPVENGTSYEYRARSSTSATQPTSEPRSVSACLAMPRNHHR